MSTPVPATAVAALTTRYSDAYAVARAIDGFGITIKAIGILIGALLAFGSLVMAGESGLGSVIVFAGVVAGGVIATLLYLLGTLASAQGQILAATLDTAVNTSRFLADDDRARILSLQSPAGAV